MPLREFRTVDCRITEVYSWPTVRDERP
jgi:hypothetical protein